MKGFRRLKQIDQHREFHTFWSEFQRLVSDAEIFDEVALLEDLKDKMSFDLQKTLASDVYKATDLHEFARLCQFTDQTLRDVESKSTRGRGYGFATVGRGQPIIITSQRENTSASQSIGRPTPQANQSWRAQSQAFGQVNEFRCYNCNEPGHMFRNCLKFQRSRNPRPATVREITEENVDGGVKLDQGKNQSSS